MGIITQWADPVLKAQEHSHSSRSLFESHQSHQSMHPGFFQLTPPLSEIFMSSVTLDMMGVLNLTSHPTFTVLPASPWSAVPINIVDPLLELYSW